MHFCKLHTFFPEFQDFSNFYTANIMKFKQQHHLLVSSFNQADSREILKRRGKYSDVALLRKG